jgi:hypothetical protein
VGSEPLGKFSTLLDSSMAYKNSDSHRYDPICRVLNMELLQFYYSQTAASCNMEVLLGSVQNSRSTVPDGTWGHLVHRTSASGCVPTGPTTHTLIAYCDRLWEATDGGADDVHTLSSNATLTPRGVHSASQRPNDCAEVTTSGEETL